MKTRSAPMALRHAASYSLARYLVWFVAATAISIFVVADRWDWRFEMARATDAGGLYLLLVLPCWFGLAVWEAQRTRVGQLQVLAPVQAPGRALALSCAGVGVWAVGFHVLFVLGLIAVSFQAGGFGYPLLLLPLVQLISIAGFVAAGALLGWNARSPLAAPLAGGGLFVLTLLLTEVTNIRRLAGLGTGGHDFYGTAPGRFGLLVQASAPALAIVSVIVGARVRRGGLRLTHAASGFLIGALVLFTLFGPPRADSTASYREVCGTQRRTMCAPATYEPRIDDLTLMADASGDLITELGGVVPERMVAAEMVGAPQPGEAVMIFEAPDLFGDTEALRRAQITALVQPVSCDWELGPSLQQWEIYGLLEEYVLYSTARLDVPIEGRAKDDLLVQFLALSEPQRRSWMAETTEAMWQCRADDLGLPDSLVSAVSE